jgi:(p)ppGpp synthase/HD superfamily hydrolase
MKYTEAAFRALEHDMINLASDRHKHQTYGGDKPYTFHLRAVRDVVYRFMPFLPYGVSIEVVVLGSWGHDLIEDTGMSREELAERYGQEVGDIIWHVSDELTDEETLKKIRQCVGAVFLKLCDRIANVEAGGKTAKYRKKYPLFRAILYKEGEFEPMWEHLDKLLA